MLRVFGPYCPVFLIDAKSTTLPEGVVWIDLFEPTKDEEALAEKLVGTNIPTREELSEIEPSSRLYQRQGAAFMTMSVLYGINDGHPDSDPIGFILTDKHIVSIRYVDPRPFVIFAEYVYAEPEIANDPNTLFVRLLDSVVDRLADDVAVLRRGVLEELGPRDQILRNPQTEYTQRLVAAVPVPNPAEQRRRREATAGLFE